MFYNNIVNPNYPCLDWLKDSSKPKDELYERALTYCLDYLQLNPTIFTGQRQFYQGYSSEIYLSGGRQWHHPTYSLSLSLIHPLEPEVLEEEYIILYHGVKNNLCYKDIFKTKLKAGPAQAFHGSRGKNPKFVVPNGIYGSQFLNVSCMGYSDHSFPIIIQFASKDYVQTSQKTYFVVQDAIPLKLIFPFQHPSRMKQYMQ